MIIVVIDVFAVRNPEDSKRAMLGMCYILDPDLSLPNKVITILNSDPNKVVIVASSSTQTLYRWPNA